MVICNLITNNWFRKIGKFFVRPLPSSVKFGIVAASKLFFIILRQCERVHILWPCIKATKKRLTYCICRGNMKAETPTKICEGTYGRWSLQRFDCMHFRSRSSKRVLMAYFISRETTRKWSHLKETYIFDELKYNSTIGINWN